MPVLTSCWGLSPPKRPEAAAAPAATSPPATSHAAAPPPATSTVLRLRWPTSHRFQNQVQRRYVLTTARASGLKVCSVCYSNVLGQDVRWNPGMWTIQ
jgi:hypothetical protein